jgi:hypothetical protein
MPRRTPKLVDARLGDESRELLNQLVRLESRLVHGGLSMRVASKNPADPASVLRPVR